MVTGRFCWPCGPLFGLTDSKTGVDEVTVNPLTRVATSVPVVRVTVRVPGAAE